MYTAFAANKCTDFGDGSKNKGQSGRNGKGNGNGNGNGNVNGNGNGGNGNGACGGGGQPAKAKDGAAVRRSSLLGLNRLQNQARMRESILKVIGATRLQRHHGQLVAWTELPPDKAKGQVVVSKHVLNRAGRYRAVFFLGGSPIPIAATRDFIASYAAARLVVHAAPCGQRLVIEYELNYAQVEHCENDWIGIVPDGAPPCRTAAVKWALLSDENEGVVEIAHGPMYPGTYRAHLFLSEYDDRVAGSSEPFECKIDLALDDASARLANREVRLYLSSQWDMSAERRALIELAVPALKRFCDDRRVSFTYVDVRSDVPFDEARSTAAGVRAMLDAQVSNDVAPKDWPP
jgi:hypothetical protein